MFYIWGRYLVQFCLLQKSNHHIFSPQPGHLHEPLMHVAYETTKEIRTYSFAPVPLPKICSSRKGGKRQ